MEHSKYRAELDVLRALAIILVIFYHLEIEIFNLSIFRGGFLGVDIFCNIWVLNILYNKK